jgi:hypothetical protein
MSAMIFVLGSVPQLRDQPEAFGSLPNAPWCNSDRMTNKCWRQAAANYRLAACAPRK